MATNVQHVRHNLRMLWESVKDINAHIGRTSKTDIDNLERFISKTDDKIDNLSDTVHTYNQLVDDRVKSLEDKLDYDETSVVDRISFLEQKPDYNDTPLSQRIQGAETHIVTVKQDLFKFVEESKHFIAQCGGDIELLRGRVDRNAVATDRINKDLSDFMKLYRDHEHDNPMAGMSFWQRLWWLFTGRV